MISKTILWRRATFEWSDCYTKMLSDEMKAKHKIQTANIKIKKTYKSAGRTMFCLDENIHNVVR